MAYSEKEKKDLIDRICSLIEEGKSLRQAAKETNVPYSVFYEWIDLDKDKSKQYARACEIRAELIADEMLNIADDGTNDYMTVTKGDESYNVEDREVTNRSKLRVDTRKWLLSKMMPKKYGDKLDITSDNEKIQPVTVVEIVRPKD